MLAAAARGQTDHELRGCVDPRSGDLDEQLLAAAEHLDIGVVAGWSRRCSSCFDLISKDASVGNNIIVELASLDLPAASSDLSGLQERFRCRPG